MSKGVMSWPLKVFYQNSQFWPSYYLLKKAPNNVYSFLMMDMTTEVVAYEWLFLIGTIGYGLWSIISIVVLYFIQMYQFLHFSGGVNYPKFRQEYQMETQDMGSFYSVWPMFGLALYNERNTFCGDSTTDNNCVANQ